MKIYVDRNEFKCQTSKPDGDFLEVETSFFDGKCQAYIAGYRYIPHGESRKLSDGTVFHGEMAAPWKPYSELAAAQAQYEADLAAAAAAYQEGVNTAYDQ